MAHQAYSSIKYTCLERPISAKGLRKKEAGAGGFDPDAAARSFLHHLVHIDREKMGERHHGRSPSLRPTMGLLIVLFPAPSVSFFRSLPSTYLRFGSCAELPSLPTSFLLPSSHRPHSGVRTRRTPLPLVSYWPVPVPVFAAYPPVEADLERSRWSPSR